MASFFLIASALASDSVATPANYVALENAPGCGSKLVDEAECTQAAQELGYKGTARVGSWKFAPYGCHVGTAANNFADTYFNTDVNGQTGGEWTSICRASLDYLALENAPGCEAKFMVDESECTRAAKELGYAGSARVGSWKFAPYGCHVGTKANGWVDTFFNTDTKGQRGGEWRSICRTRQVSTNYVASENAPGCASKLLVDEAGCKSAANELGYKGSVRVGSWKFAPYGCHVGTAENNFADTYFNTDIHGKNLDSKWKSICKISQEYVALDNGPGCESEKLQLDETECSKAAFELGYKAGARVGSWSFAPFGCHVGTGVNGWKDTFYNTDVNGQTGDNRWRSICRISQDYVALENGPSCESNYEVDESECTKAAKELGFNASARVGSWSFAPYGCHVGTAENGWRNTYFNTDVNGKTGDKKWKSICRASPDHTTIIIIGSVLSALVLLALVIVLIVVIRQRKNKTVEHEVDLESE